MSGRFRIDLEVKVLSLSSVTASDSCSERRRSYPARSSERATIVANGVCRPFSVISDVGSHCRETC